MLNKLFIVAILVQTIFFINKMGKCCSKCFKKKDSFNNITQIKSSSGDLKVLENNNLKNEVLVNKDDFNRIDRCSNLVVEEHKYNNLYKSRVLFQITSDKLGLLF